MTDKKRSAETTIAGYLYQFDKTIIEILKSEGKYLIEGIEDIDINRPNEEVTLLQIKYHSKVKYQPSEIKKPIQLMLEHFKAVKKEDKTPVTYHLYAHFKEGHENLILNEDGNLIDQENKTALDFLKNEFLTYTPQKDKKTGEQKLPVYYWKSQTVDDRELSDEEIIEFISKLKIETDAKDINEQLDEVLNSLNTAIEHCQGKSEAEDFFYNNALRVIADKAKKSNVSEREITKAEFLKLIDKKQYLFNKWFAWHRGASDYADFILRRIKEKRFDLRTKNKCLYISETFLKPTADNFKVFHLLENIIKSSFDFNNALDKKDKVWTVVLECDLQVIKEYKTKLREKSYKISDGHEHTGFIADNFMKPPVINSDASNIIVNAEFQLRLITAETFKNNFSDINKQLDSFLYFSDKPFEEIIKNSFDFPLLAIENSKFFNSIADINKIFSIRNIENDYFRIVSVSANQFEVEVTKPSVFYNKNDRFTLGSYVKIADKFETEVIGILRNYKIKSPAEKETSINTQKQEPSFTLDVKPVGHLKKGEFHKGGNTITIPPSEVEIAKPALLKEIFTEKNRERAFCFGSIPDKLIDYSEKIKVELNGDKFFNKHLAVVGSTGSGKSCTVAKILHEGIESSIEQKNNGLLNNSHILIFDLHGEYHHSFKENCRYLSVNKLVLPYWLMNSDELEFFFLGSDVLEKTQRSIFKLAVTFNKKYHNPKIINRESEETKEIDDNVTYDTPKYFSIKEIIVFIKNFNNARVVSNTNIVTWLLDEDNTIENKIPTNWNELDIFSSLYKNELKPIGTLGQNGTKQAEEYHGAFTSLITRLENKLDDDRLKFLLKKGCDYHVELKKVTQLLLGYEVDFKKNEQNNKGIDFNKKYDKKNVIIVDLSGFPFEVINITVAVISRLLFNFAFQWKRHWDRKQRLNESLNDKVDTPFLVVYEEAHNYIPKIDNLKYKEAREAVERIAKEGRKYGISAMIVSQRPSEISETIFSQCNSFVVMRLTNPTDQNYIRRLLPDDVGSITDNLSTFDQREALILGDAIAMPAIVEIDELDADKLPKSNDIEFIQKWRENWNKMEEFEDIIKELENEK